VPSLTPRLRESLDPPIAEFKSRKGEHQRRLPVDRGRDTGCPVLTGWTSTACPHTRPPKEHAQARSESTCQVNERSPCAAAFPPHSPLTMFRLCSNALSVLCRGVTPRKRTCGPCGLSLTPRPAFPMERRCLRGLPVLVHEVSRRVWGLRLRRTEQELALTRQLTEHQMRSTQRVRSYPQTTLPSWLHLTWNVPLSSVPSRNFRS
jgi:hypothetical protein